VRPGGHAIPLSFLAGVTLLILACVDIPTGSSSVLSFQFDPLPSPSVVLGDSLRDTLGVAQPIAYKAFNYSGDEVPDVTVRFSAVGRGIRVDSIKGFVIGDSVQSAAKIAARLKEFTNTLSIAVTLRPDTAIASNSRDSLSYTLTDTLNVSPGVGIRLIHGKVAGDSAVASYLVSFRIVSQSNASLARLVGDNNLPSSIDTTDASGVAARKIRIDVTKLTNPVDSVIVEAVAKYRGAPVRGTPARLVVRLKPK
jgi:hypothetical protein